VVRAVLAEQVVDRQRDGGRERGDDADAVEPTSGPDLGDQGDRARAAQTRLRTGWRMTNRAQSATMRTAVYSSSSAMLTGIRAMATK
jgi:hypothetical protein